MQIAMLQVNRSQTPPDSVQHRARSFGTKRSERMVLAYASGVHVLPRLVSPLTSPCIYNIEGMLQVTNRRSGLPRCVIAMRALNPLSVKTPSQRQ
ncbi:hypothetical protein ACN38_g5884 [Penicillium nordicum]|uniref:Uncharacterized protein n=1 Tax=Penicillium nordicum TaxID=229535 RepID=A0A0M8P831_9EURO|nr:hypothetical protein ACN38_g5884 [Penicillium nordicum]